MRQIVTGLALLAVTACGQATASRPAARPAPTITVEAARAVAKAGTLTKADLPGYRAEQDDPVLGVQGGTCLREVDPLADGYAAFSSGRRFAVSEVDVMRTVEEALELAAYAAGPEFAPCLERALTAGLATGFTVLDYTSTAFTVRVTGAARTFGYTVRMRLRDDGRSVPMSLHYLGAAAGHAVAGVMVTGVGAAPLSRARATALLAKAVKRAAAKER